MKPKITIDKQRVDKYMLICTVASTLNNNGLRAEQSEFMSSIYLDADATEVLQLASKYVEILYKGE